MSSPCPYRNKSEMVDAAVLEKLEAGFAKLAASDSKSLLKKYLTKEVFDALKNKKTPSFGSTLLDVIQSGLENHDSGVGIYAPDAEAYTTFADLFDPIIEDYHTGFKKTDKHPAKDFGDNSVFGDLDPTGEFVVSTRVRCGRSMEGYPFNPCLTEAQYKEMEQKVSTTLAGLEGELKGKFYPLTGMDKATQQQLIDDHFLFKEGTYARKLLVAEKLRLMDTFFLPQQEIASCSLPTLAVSGHQAVVSTTMTPRPSWSGAMRKITSVSSPCKWEETSAKFSVA